jgi:anti-sigma factor (TIGR02949 family)
VTSPDHVIERLDDYLDGELRPGDMSLVRAHLASCPTCAEEYRRAAGTLSAVRERLRQVAIPPDLRTRLGAALRELSSASPH